MEFLKFVLDFVFPPICGICGKLNKSYLCDECKKEIEKYYYTNELEKDMQFYLLKYDGIIRERLINYKFNDKSYLYRLFSQIILNSKSACDFLKNYEVILPVPIHIKRYKERGYNQSELIAREVARKLNLKLETKVLVKNVHNKPQSTMNKINRLKNVHNVYKVQNAHTIKEKSIVIFDDIYTTGATTQECKKVLLDAGAKKVAIFTVAKD